jgi:hypothetical protein
MEWISDKHKHSNCSVNLKRYRKHKTRICKTKTNQTDRVINYETYKHYMKIKSILSILNTNDKSKSKK